MPSWLLALIAALPQLIPGIIAIIDQIIAIFGGTPIASAPNFISNLQAVKTDLLAVHGEIQAQIKAKGIRP